MTAAFSISSSILESLGRLFPPKNILIVGTAPSWPQSPILGLEYEQVSIVEMQASEDKISTKRDALQAASVYHAIPAETSGSAVFYEASLPAESGLIPSERLKALWQNITPLREYEVTTTTLDKISDKEDLSPTWLALETLNSLDVLKGATQLLTTLDIIITRSVMNPGVIGGEVSLTHPELNTFLIKHGFVEVDRLPDRHAEIAKSIFAKKWKRDFKRAVSQFDELKHEFDQNLQTLTVENEELEAKLVELEADLKRATQARALAENNILDLQSQHTSLAEVCTEQARIISEIEAHLLAAQKWLLEGAPQKSETQAKPLKRNAKKN